MRKTLGATMLLLASLWLAPGAHAASQECYPPPCQGQVLADGAGTIEVQTSPALPLPLRTEAPGGESPAPFVGAGLSMVAAVFLAITSRRWVTIARREGLRPRAGAEIAVPAPQPEHSFR